jgi:hypothetical protein
MPTLTEIRLHPIRTVNGRQYQFTPKHHGSANYDAACWLRVLSFDEEFAVFDTADTMDIADASGNLFGAVREGENSLRRLGTFGQQIARFPATAGDNPWHGYPVWALLAAAQSA